MSENEFQIPGLERRKNNNLSKNKITVMLKRVFLKKEKAEALLSLNLKKKRRRKKRILTVKTEMDR